VKGSEGGNLNEVLCQFHARILDSAAYYFSWSSGGCMRNLAQGPSLRAAGHRRNSFRSAGSENVLRYNRGKEDFVEPVNAPIRHILEGKLFLSMAVAGDLMHQPQDDNDDRNSHYQDRHDAIPDQEVPN